MISRMRAAERDGADIFCFTLYPSGPSSLLPFARVLAMTAVLSQLEPDQRQQNRNRPERGDAEDAAAAKLLLVGADARFRCGLAFFDQPADPLQPLRRVSDEPRKVAGK